MAGEGTGSQPAEGGIPEGVVLFPGPGGGERAELE